MCEIGKVEWLGGMVLRNDFSRAQASAAGSGASIALLAMKVANLG